MLDGGQNTQEDFLPKTTIIMDAMQVTIGNKIMRSIFTIFVPLMHKLCFDSLNVNVISFLNDQYNNQDHVFSRILSYSMSPSFAATV